MQYQKPIVNGLNRRVHSARKAPLKLLVGFWLFVANVTVYDASQTSLCAMSSRPIIVK